jgi:pyruvate formate lyase activating enzyme
MDQEKGIIFNIQRFSIHDGPGIRTTVFMKGCPLRCLWCSNPESQDPFPNLMVRDILCVGCGACADACPEGAIRMIGGAGRKIDWDRCTQCLACVNACLYQSLNACGRYVTVEEVLDEVLRDEAFYRNSGGGMTVSGGEPLSQAPFVKKLLAAAKGAGLHTVLDTTGFAPWDRLEEVLPFVDLLLWDVKHLDPAKHREATGVDNAIILRNVVAASSRVPVWLRVPLIAGFNDSAGNLGEILLLGKKVHAAKISLLPYHEGGKSKCEQLGRTYPFPQGETPEDDYVQSLKGMIEKEGFKAAIGS